MLITGIIIGLVVGIPLGYIVALYYGKPAREWKKLEAKGIDIYTKAKEKIK